MSRFANLPPAPRSGPAALGPRVTTGLTFEGGKSYTSADPKAELFFDATSGLLADGFYESGDQRLERLRSLTQQAAMADPMWVRQFCAWLRGVANLRSAPIVIAAEYAALKLPDSRQVVNFACQRADEPGEFLSYWRAIHGRTVPSRVKRGLSDACQRLYTQRSLARYDGQGKGYRFGDVLEVIHAVPKDSAQSVLYKYALDRRRHPNEQAPGALQALQELRRFMDATPELRAQWRDAGQVPSLLSWEALAAATPGGLDAAWWSKLAVSRNMGLMAVLRNLNNIDRAGVTDEQVIAAIRWRLTDSEDIAAARLLPYRFLMAYRASETDRWREALSAGAEHALHNLPEFPGTTLIMVDCSGSMSSSVGSGKSRQPLTLSELAGFMAESIARRCEAHTIVCYDTQVLSSHSTQYHVPVLKAATDKCYTPNGGTNTWRVAKQLWQGTGRNVDRIIIITDEQSSDNDDGSITCPVITWNLAGGVRHHTHHGKRNRFLVSGYSDTALQTLPDVIVHGVTGRWPWEVFL